MVRLTITTKDAQTAAEDDGWERLTVPRLEQQSQRQMSPSARQIALDHNLPIIAAPGGGAVMDFEAWLSEQRHSLHVLRVRPGRYVARYSPSTRSYSAAELLVEGAGQAIVTVSTLGVVRARVTLGAREYDFEPRWARGRGLVAHRRSPSTCDRETSDTTSGYARAALLCAARAEYDRLSGLALETDEARWEEVLLALTVQPRDASRLDTALRAAVVATLAGRGDGAQFAIVPCTTACLGCGLPLEAGVEVPIRTFGTTVVCCSCLHAARPVRVAA